MEESLKRWAELESDRCSIDEQGRAWIETEYANFTTYIDEVLEQNQMLILGATMQAIETRGWDWRIAYVKPDVWFASVYTTPSYKPEIDAKSEDSSAHALLSAYIRALENEVK